MCLLVLGYCGACLQRSWSPGGAAECPGTGSAGSGELPSVDTRNQSCGSNKGSESLSHLSGSISSIF